jgi:nucleotide-binding universal stress UspA family protein
MLAVRRDTQSRENLSGGRFAMKVLLAIDYSPASQKVLEEVAVRCWPAGTTFMVVSAVDIGRFSELLVLVEDARRECEKIVRAGAALLVQARLSATTEVLTGSPRHVVSEFAAQWGADLILVGSHNRGTVSRFFLGSVAQGILRTATCSVEIVRFPRSESAPSSHPMKILIATDGSACSLAAANSLVRRPWPTGTAFKVLSVEELVKMPIPLEASPLSSIYPASLLEELITAARTRAVDGVAAVQKVLTEAVPAASVDSLVPTGDPCGVILDTAEAWSADLVVLGSHGLRGFDRLLMGSVSESVAVHAHCSVEVVRSNEIPKA